MHDPSEEILPTRHQTNFGYEVSKRLLPKDFLLLSYFEENNWDNKYQHLENVFKPHLKKAVVDAFKSYKTPHILDIEQLKKDLQNELLNIMSNYLRRIAPQSYLKQNENESGNFFTQFKLAINEAVDELAGNWKYETEDENGLKTNNWGKKLTLLCNSGSEHDENWYIDFIANIDEPCYIYLIKKDCLQKIFSTMSSSKKFLQKYPQKKCLIIAAIMSALNNNIRLPSKLITEAKAIIESDEGAQTVASAFSVMVRPERHSAGVRQQRKQLPLSSE